MTIQLVTGATGHIGNVLFRQLLERGERVRALVRPGKTPLALQGLDVEIFPGDILDLDSLIRAMRELGFCPRPARQAILDAVSWWQERLVEPAAIPETIARAAA